MSDAYTPTVVGSRGHGKITGGIANRSLQNAEGGKHRFISYRYSAQPHVTVTIIAATTRNRAETTNLVTCCSFLMKPRTESYLLVASLRPGRVTGELTAVIGRWSVIGCYPGLDVPGERRSPILAQLEIKLPQFASNFLLIFASTEKHVRETSPAEGPVWMGRLLSNQHERGSPIGHDTQTPC